MDSKLFSDVERMKKQKNTKKYKPSVYLLFSTHKKVFSISEDSTNNCISNYTKPANLY